VKLLRAYDDHQMYIAPAQPSRALWRVLLGFFALVIGYFALLQGYFIFVDAAFGAGNAAYISEVFNGLTPQAMYLLLGSFVFMALPLTVLLPMLHKRGVRSLLGPLPLAVRQFGTVLVPLILLAVVVAILPPWDMGGPFAPNLPPVIWVALLPVSMVMVFIQVSAEELVFRGYVQQQLAARFASPVVWMVLPSVLFALAHYDPDGAGSNAWFLVIWAGVFGTLMADITARAGTLGPAIALHFMNNLLAIVFVSVPDSLSGLALFHAPFGLEDEAQVRAWLPVDFAHMFVMWLVARLALRR